MTYFNLFANCQVVKGFSMSLIVDLQLRTYYHIPNDLFDVIKFLSEGSVEDCIENYGIKNKSIIKSYINFLVKNDLGFVDDSIIKELSTLSLTWDNYSPITNVIIEYSSFLNYNTLFFKKMLSLNLEAIEVRSFDVVDFEELQQFLAHFIESTVLDLKLILKWDKWCTKKNLSKLVNDHLRVSSVILHSSPQSKSLRLMKDSVLISFNTMSLVSNLQCGIIQPTYFSASINLFTESQQHNTCLNRKLSIDKEGFIRNCPSMTNDFGYISTTSLEEVLNHPDLKKNWYIHKGQISVCKDCEFRHICTDCRAFIEQPEDIYSKPLKCGYNPYTNVWEDWTNNPLKQDAIKYYELEALV